MDQRRSDFEPMRRWLRQHYQVHYDHMWTHAEDFADAAGEANPTDPWNGILVSICLGQQQEISTLRQKNSDLEASLSEIRGKLDRLEEAVNSD